MGGDKYLFESLSSFINFYRKVSTKLALTEKLIKDFTFQKMLLLIYMWVAHIIEKQLEHPLLPKSIHCTLKYNGVRKWYEHTTPSNNTHAKLAMEAWSLLSSVIFSTWWQYCWQFSVLPACSSILARSSNICRVKQRKYLQASKSRAAKIFCTPNKIFMQFSNNGMV